MANNLLPVRAGEFARAYAAQQQLPVRFSTALASVGVERVLDGLLLVGLMMLAIASPAFPGHAQIGMTSVSRITVGAAVFFGAVLVVAVLVVHRPAPWLTLLRRATHPVLPERIAARLTRIAEGLIAALEVLKSPARFSRSEEHTSELQSQSNLVCRLLLEKKKKTTYHQSTLATIVTLSL